MNPPNQPDPVKDDRAVPSGYREVPWPERGRKVFGPWCLLGAWPAIFGVIEKVDEPEHGKNEPPKK